MCFWLPFLIASWNPADDEQAIDRAYRIGQTKDVEVYRLLCGGTIETMMYDRQAAKEGLKRTVVGNLPIGKDRHFDTKELRKLFTLTDPKQSDLREKFQGRGIVPDQERHQVLRRHEAVVDIFSHNDIYTSSSSSSKVTATDDVDQEQLTSEEENIDPRSFLGQRFAYCLDDGDEIVIYFGTVHEFYPKYESDENIEKWSVRFDKDDNSNKNKGKETTTSGDDDENAAEEEKECGCPENLIVVRSELVTGVELYKTNKQSDPNYNKKQKLN